MPDPKMVHMPAQDVVDKIKVFEEADTKYTQTWADFEEKAAQWFSLLDGMREDRNRKLDVAVRALREEAGKLDYHKVKSFKLGSFKVEKKLRRYFLPQEFTELVKDLGLYDRARAAHIVTEKVEVDTELAAAWLHENDLQAKFQDTYREEDMTPAVSGPKEVPPFGTPTKKG